MIFLNKNNIYYKKNGNKTQKKVSSIFPFLEETIEISDDFNLSNFFDIVLKDIILFDIIFKRCIGGFDFENFIKEIKCDNNDLEEIERIDVSDISYLETCWSCELFEFNQDDDQKYKGSEVNYYLSFYPTFYGVPKEGSILSSVSLVNLSLLKDIPIKIKEIAYISIFGERDNKDKDKYKGYVSEKEFTVYDFFKVILYDISFYGDRVGKKNMLKTLNESLEDIDVKGKLEDLKDIIKNDKKCRNQ